jgi:hypothetical protein
MINVTINSSELCAIDDRTVQSRMLLVMNDLWIRACAYSVENSDCAFFPSWLPHSCIYHIVEEIAGVKEEAQKDEQREIIMVIDVIALKASLVRFFLNVRSF